MSLTACGLLVLGCGGGGGDHVSTSSSGNYLEFNELKSKLESAQDGDTVTIPAGTCIVTEQIVVTKNIKIIGAGIDQTILLGSNANKGGLIAIHGHNVGSSPRVSGITFTFDRTAVGVCGIWLTGYMANFRIDHCKFEYALRGIWSMPMAYGVIDHCDFHDDGLCILTDRDLDQSTWGGSGVTWAGYPNPSPGDPIDNGNAIFNEDCHYLGDDDVSCMCSIDGMNGAKYVFRHNTVDMEQTNSGYPLATAHGNQSHSITGYRGTYSSEIYDNTFHAKNAWYGIFTRGGTGVIFNNVMTGAISMPVCFMDYGSCSYKDPSTGDYYGAVYPAIDQVNNYYVWNNTLNGNPVSDGNPILYVPDGGYNRANIRINKEYFDAPMPGYAAYTYPHPLVTLVP